MNNLIQEVIAILDNHPTNDDINDIFNCLHYNTIPIEERWILFTKLAELGLLRTVITFSSSTRYPPPIPIQFDLDDFGIRFNKIYSFIDIYPRIKQLCTIEQLYAWQTHIIRLGYHSFKYEK